MLKVITWMVSIISTSYKVCISFIRKCLPYAAYCILLACLYLQIHKTPSPNQDVPKQYRCIVDSTQILDHDLEEYLLNSDVPLPIISRIIDPMHALKVLTEGDVLNMVLVKKNGELNYLKLLGTGYEITADDNGNINWEIVPSLCVIEFTDLSSQQVGILPENLKQELFELFLTRHVLSKTPSRRSVMVGLCLLPDGQPYIKACTIKRGRRYQRHQATNSH